MAAAPKFEIAIAAPPANLRLMFKSVAALAATLLTVNTMSAQNNSPTLAKRRSPARLIAIANPG